MGIFKKIDLLLLAMTPEKASLFALDEKIILADSPLSARMRPSCIEEYVGQRHILGEGKLLTRAITADRIT